MVSCGSGGVKPGGLGVVQVPPSPCLAVLEHSALPQTLPKIQEVSDCGAHGHPWSVVWVGRSRSWWVPRSYFMEEEVWARWRDGQHRQSARYETHRQERAGEGSAGHGLCVKPLRPQPGGPTHRHAWGRRCSQSCKRWTGTSDSRALARPVQMLMLAT